MYDYITVSELSSAKSKRVTAAPGSKIRGKDTSCISRFFKLGEDKKNPGIYIYSKTSKIRLANKSIINLHNGTFNYDKLSLTGLQGELGQILASPNAI